MYMYHVTTWHTIYDSAYHSSSWSFGSEFRLIFQPLQMRRFLAEKFVGPVVLLSGFYAGAVYMLVEVP